MGQVKDFFIGFVCVCFRMLEFEVLMEDFQEVLNFFYLWVFLLVLELNLSVN